MANTTAELAVESSSVLAPAINMQNITSAAVVHFLLDELVRELKLFA
ncbi:26S proteasome regulatory subunit rpn2 [Culex quinquefasciatus]|uniref:26S proteasome regulatory subunit rpn2 n=1 Tax=Culex quinquefasciatus TaxID=7176 RepID=B0XD27_CULQU|nr:26S proteasome regulatory subunit rpn2 [Culex quinquefasciatus]|eukprot:XP_001867549.1 26S proteasome regulatory subunit rpn2 [Culex quinquefasciatus]